MTIAEIEEKNFEAELQKKNQNQLQMVEHDNGRKQKQIGEKKKQLEDEEYEIRRLKEEAEKVIEMERAARSRIRSPRPAEMSIQTINAAVKWNAITTSATYAAVTARTRSNL